MATTSEKGTVRVQVNSVDGNLTHPFKRTDTVADLQRYAYEKLVQDKTAIPLSATSIEFGGTALSAGESLGTLASGEKNPGHEIDLVVALTWVSQGG